MKIKIIMKHPVLKNLFQKVLLLIQFLYMKSSKIRKDIEPSKVFYCFEDEKLLYFYINKEKLQSMKNVFSSFLPQLFITLLNFQSIFNTSSIICTLFSYLIFWHLTGKINLSNKLIDNIINWIIILGFSWKI